MQIFTLLFHQRDEKGEIIPELAGAEAEDVSTPELALRALWRRAYGLNQEQLDRKWQEFLRLEGYRAHLEKQGAKPADIERLIREKERELRRA